MFEGLSNLAALWKNARQISGRLQALNDELRQKRVTGAAGGGMVEIECNGLLEVLRCRIDPQLIAQGDHELIEDLVASAVNQAVQKAKQIHAEAITALTGGVELPGLREAIARFTGESPPAE